MSVSNVNPAALDAPSGPPATPRSSPALLPALPPPTPEFCLRDDDDVRLLTMASPEWLNPLFGFAPGDHPPAENQLREYLQAVPRPDNTGDWDLDDAAVWLDTATVSEFMHVVFILLLTLCRILWSES